MAAPQRRRHAAASARILTAGLSSAAAMGMVAGMAWPAADDEAVVAPAPDAVTIPVVVAPLPARVAAAQPAVPAPRPVTRSRGS